VQEYTSLPASYTAASVLTPYNELCVDVVSDSSSTSSTNPLSDFSLTPGLQDIVDTPTNNTAAV